MRKNLSSYRIFTHRAVLLHLERKKSVLHSGAPDSVPALLWAANTPRRRAERADKLDRKSRIEVQSNKK